jgi:hypothetical protein
MSIFDGRTKAGKKFANLKDGRTKAGKMLTKIKIGLLVVLIAVTVATWFWNDISIFLEI